VIERVAGPAEVVAATPQVEGEETEAPAGDGWVRRSAAAAAAGAASSSSGGSARGASPTGVLRLQRLAGNAAVCALLRKERGVPAPTGIRRSMEDRSGIDLSDVRIHRRSSAPAALGAEAFARGRDVHLGPGADHHLPHELWHVVQQRQGRVPTTGTRAGVGVNQDPALEAEADRGGAGAPSIAPSGPSDLVVQGVFFPAGTGDRFVDETGAVFMITAAIGPGLYEVQPADLSSLPFRIERLADGTWDAVDRMAVDSHGAPPPAGPDAAESMDGPGDDVVDAVGSADGGAAVQGEPHVVVGQADEAMPAAPAAPVMGNPRSPFTADVAVATDQGAWMLTPDQVRVLEIDVPEVRVPTSLPGGRQGRHTVAFLLLRRSLANMGGRSATDLLAMLEVRLAETARWLTPSGEGVLAGAAPDVDPADRVAQLTRVMQRSQEPAPLHAWNERLGDLIRLFVDLYHLSTVAAFPSKNPIGGRERWAAQGLGALEGKAAAGVAVTPAELVQAGVDIDDLLDIARGRPPAVYATAVNRLFEELRTAFPALTTTYPQVFDRVRNQALSPSMTAALTAARDQRIAAAAPDAPAPPALPVTVGELLVYLQYADDGRHGLVPAQAAVPVVPGAVVPAPAHDADDDAAQPTRRNPFRATVAVMPHGALPDGAGADTPVEAADVDIATVRTTTSRPPTNAEGQNSHTVPFTLLRAELAALSGRPAAELVAWLQARRAELQVDGADLQAMPLLDGAPRTLVQWQHDLGRAVTGLVVAHQTAASATYVDNRSHLGDPRVPNPNQNMAVSHGEPAHMKRLRGVEVAVRANPAEPINLHAMANAAAQLVDVSVALHPSLSRRAFLRWRQAIQTAFPTLWARWGRAMVDAALARQVGDTSSVLLGAHLAADPATWQPVGGAAVPPVAGPVPDMAALTNAPGAGLPAEDLVARPSHRVRTEEAAAAGDDDAPVWEAGGPDADSDDDAPMLAAVSASSPPPLGPRKRRSGEED
jgi:hypothetical protein